MNESIIEEVSERRMTTQGDCKVLADFPMNNNSFERIFNDSG
jgi:hypothetical protein